jgi:GH24 family phage-related lysozyme (muramidase)
MNRLLLSLFLLFPAILFGQERQRAMVDSIQSAAPDLQRVSDLINNTPGAKIDYIHAADNDGYITVVVRVHVPDPVVVHALSAMQVITMKSADIVPDRVTTLPVPPAPFFFVADTIPAVELMAVFNLKVGDVRAAKMDFAIVPPPPYIIVTDTIPALELRTISTLLLSNAPAAKMNMAIVPPPPYIIVTDTIPAVELSTVVTLQLRDVPPAKMEMAAVPPPPVIKDDVNALILSAIAQLRIEDIPVDKIDNIAVPPLPYIIASIEAVPVVSVIPCSIGQIAVVKMNTAPVPAIPDIQTEDVLPLIAAVELVIPQPAVGKMEMATFPAFEKNEVTVADMHLSADGYALLEKMEGFSPELYALGDGGCTIGFGFFVPYAEIGKWRKGVTWEEAEHLIRQKVPAYEDQVKQYINVPLIQEEFDALTMLAYNLGGFSRATSIVNDINNNAGFDKLQHDWMRFVHSKAPNVLKGLLNRRNDEMQVRRESNYQPDRKILVYKNKRG